MFLTVQFTVLHFLNYYLFLRLGFKMGLILEKQGPYPQVFQVLLLSSH